MNLYIKAHEAIKENGINDPIVLMSMCMEIIDKEEMSGEQKAVIVKDTLTQFVDQNILPTNMASKIKIMIDNDLLQSTMDAIVCATKNGYDINKKNTSTKSTKYNGSRDILRTVNSHIFGGYVT